MITPNARDIFDWLDFSNEMTPELDKRRQMLIETLKRSVSDEKSADMIAAAASYFAGEAQFVGFMQGFRLASALFCEPEC